MWRIFCVTMVGLAGTIGVFVLLLLPDLIKLALPEAVCEHWPSELFLVCAVVFVIARRSPAAGQAEQEAARRTRSIIDRIARFAEWALERGFARALGLLCIVLLLTWIPHYLTWPWSRDPETFAVLAQSWDCGILPYRDIRAYNFPGAIYLAWLFGKLFGWGHTVPLYAFDAGCVVLLGLVMVAWSRRRLGTALPGLIGYFAFLAEYLGLAYDLVAQRDWHTALFLCLGLLLMQTWPGRLSRFASAVAAALALTIRPHAVLFVPALLWEAAHGLDFPATGASRRLRVIAVWCAWFGLAVTLAFAPLFLAGIADDLVRGLRVAAYGGPYSKTTPHEMIRSFAEQFYSWRTDIPLVATLALGSRCQQHLSRIARTWALVWLGAIVYEPIHPVHHLYLHLPVMLVSSITWALAVAWLLSSHRLAKPMRVLVLAYLAYELMPAPPWMCNFEATIRAVPSLCSGEIPAEPPVGAIRAFPRLAGRSTRWNDYRAVLLYIRSETAPTTLVANVLTSYPFETINGPAGRLSPFRAESGVCWMTQVNLNLDSEFAEALSRSPNSVVVWAPSRFSDNTALPLPHLAAAIQQYYQRAAQFGTYEVWRRKSAPGVPPTGLQPRTPGQVNGSRQVSKAPRNPRLIQVRPHLALPPSNTLGRHRATIHLRSHERFQSPATGQVSVSRNERFGFVFNDIG